MPLTTNAMRTKSQRRRRRTRGETPQRSIGPSTTHVFNKIRMAPPQNNGSMPLFGWMGTPESPMWSIAAENASERPQHSKQVMEMASSSAGSSEEQENSPGGKRSSWAPLSGLLALLGCTSNPVSRM